MSASDISPAAAAAREAVRQNGQFGTQNHADPGQVPIAPVYDPIRFSFDGMPEHPFPALSYGQLWNGWEAPVIDKATMQRILTVSEQTFTWDGDTAVIENNAGEGERFDHLEDGTYDLGELGWTFRRVLPGDFDCQYCGRPFSLEEEAERHEEICSRNDDADYDEE